MKYNNIFIDLDDTLWDFKTNSKTALKHIYDTFSLQRYYPDFEEFHILYMKRNNELWSLYHHGKLTKENLVIERFRYPLLRVGIDDLRLASAINECYLNVLSQQKALRPHALSLLRYLSKKYPLSILSNGFSETQYKKLEASEITLFFKHVILSEDIGVTKPHPDIFTYALKKTGSKREESIFIGDNFDADILGAYNSNIDQIYYNPDRTPVPGEVKPTFEVVSLEEIEQIL